MAVFFRQQILGQNFIGRTISWSQSLFTYRYLFPQLRKNINSKQHGLFFYRNSRDNISTHSCNIS